MTDDKRETRGRPGFGKRRLVKVYIESEDYDALKRIAERVGVKVSEFLRDIIQGIVRKG